MTHFHGGWPLAVSGGEMMMMKFTAKQARLQQLYDARRRWNDRNTHGNVIFPTNDAEDRTIGQIEDEIRDLHRAGVTLPEKRVPLTADESR